MSNVPKTSKEIINYFNNFIQEAKNSLLSLNEAALEYSMKFENSIELSLEDSSLLKKRIKDLVIRTVNDD